jgi:hypothetical protein
MCVGEIERERRRERERVNEIGFLVIFKIVLESTPFKTPYLNLKMMG